MGQKICRYLSISHHFQDTGVFAFYAEIQDGHQKWPENDFQGNLPVDSGDTLRVKNFIDITLACSISEINTFYAEIQDGRQKWRENNICENLPVHCTDTLVG